MKYIKVKTYEELSRKAAAVIAAQVISKPNSVLGLATGSSPIGTYENLAKACDNGDLDFSDVTSVNLDEYVGLSTDNDQSYRYFMNKNLFEKINIKMENTNVPNGCAADIEAECKRYDALIEDLGGIDLQLLGIGLDGHIGFNEPCEEFVKGTNRVTLDPSTIEANARFFASIDEVPREAVTMGMQAIMQAKKVLLIANGKNKAEIMEKAFFGPITPKVPASILQLHPDLTVIYSEN
ncbi:MAG: glucosamine-6-phosphate deaminase [Clostridia bacterium]|nr:glucosamine-6-phosphate deaminase [Clostridia bacterium]